jgi:hypothetical protein
MSNPLNLNASYGQLTLTWSPDEVGVTEHYTTTWTNVKLKYVLYEILTSRLYARCSWELSNGVGGGNTITLTGSNP